jgi:ectoine hydroxylase-related dioxygenase (phytanoyl-CoA dioxygenase family)
MHIQDNGFLIGENVFTNEEVQLILSTIDETDSSSPSFRKTKDVFAIRRFLQEVPSVVPLIFNKSLTRFIDTFFGPGYFPVKSIYFDKPEDSNWFVSYHQDLTISVDKKAPVEGFGPWSVKQDQFAVQPPVELLKDNFTIRIHLDDTDESNGALRVIPGSHQTGVIRPEQIDLDKKKEISCAVPKGGIMIMRPLLLHASSRTTNNKKRRVIHMEFSRQTLPEPLQWSERLAVQSH